MPESHTRTLNPLITASAYIANVNRLEALLGTLDEAVRDRVTGPKVAVMFSGGVDSCVIATLASRYAMVTAYTVGVEGAHDLQVAEGAAYGMQLSWRGIKVDRAEVKEAIPVVARAIGSESPLTISFEMPIYFVAREAYEQQILCGQGADELFGGYARYEPMDAPTRRERMKQDADNLISKGMPSERRLAAHFGKTMGHPFLDHRVVELTDHLPDDMLVHGGVRKVALRQVAEALGLGEASRRPKKAAQYGSGIMKTMKAMAKMEGLTLGDWTKKIIEGDGEVERP